MNCKICGKEITHDWRKIQKTTLEFCSRSCANKFASSKVRHHPGRPKGIPSKMKGLTKETSELYSKVSAALKGRVGTFKGKHHTKESREKMSIIMSMLHEETGMGGFSKCKYYKIKNIRDEEFSVQGTWELAVAKWLNENNILWVRRVYLAYVDYNGIKRHYCPDFVLLEEGRYIEVKGYFSEKDRLKIASVEDQYNIRIEVLQLKELQILGIMP